jgi:hypothetical protein
MAIDNHGGRGFSCDRGLGGPSAADEDVDAGADGWDSHGDGHSELIRKRR